MASRYQKRHYVDIANIIDRHVRDSAVTLALEQRLVNDIIARLGGDKECVCEKTIKREC